MWKTSTSDKTYRLERSIKLHDHAIVTRCMLGPWLITGGKEGGGEDNVCGLDCSRKAMRIDGSDSEVFRELGMPVVMVWAAASSEALGRVVFSLRQRGRPTLEIWESSSNVS